MTHTELNAIIEKLNLRRKWTNQAQVIKSATDQHLKTSKIEELQNSFKSLMGMYVHTNQFVNSGIYWNRWEGLSSTETLIGSRPSGFGYYIQGWDQNRVFTPVQHTYPCVWTNEINNHVKGSWTSFLDKLDDGLDELIYLPYTSWETDNYSRTETGNNFFDFGNGTITSDTHTTTTGTSPNILLNDGAEMLFSIYASHQEWNECYIKAGYSKLKLKNPHPYSITVTLLSTIEPQRPGGHYYVSGCGDCTFDYTIPEPELNATHFVSTYDNSVSNPHYETVTFNLSPNGEATYGPTGFNTYDGEDFCRDIYALRQASQQTEGLANECSSGRTFYILAYYRPLS